MSAHPPKSIDQIDIEDPPSYSQLCTPSPPPYSLTYQRQILHPPTLPRDNNHWSLTPIWSQERRISIEIPSTPPVL